MITSSQSTIVITDDVRAEVSRKSADYEFDDFLERILEHFPDGKNLEIRLVEDPDEEDRSWVDFEITLPLSADRDEVRGRTTTFFNDLIEKRAHVSQPICTIGFLFAGEKQ